MKYALTHVVVLGSELAGDLSAPPRPEGEKSHRPIKTFTLEVRAAIKKKLAPWAGPKNHNPHDAKMEFIQNNQCSSTIALSILLSWHPHCTVVETGYVAPSLKFFFVKERPLHQCEEA